MLNKFTGKRNVVQFLIENGANRHIEAIEVGEPRNLAIENGKTRLFLSKFKII